MPMMLFQMIGGGKGVVVILILAALGGYIGVLKVQNMSLEHDVRSLELDVKDKVIEITRLNGEVGQCRAKLEINNDRIADLKVNRDLQKQSFDLLAENIDAFKEVNGLKIKELQETAAPQSCELIMAFLKKGVGPQ